MKEGKRCKVMQP